MGGASAAARDEAGEYLWEPLTWDTGRLRAQARLFEPLTERFLLEAGLRPGMTVLDAAAGHGDVTLVAARIVGPQGRVVALERTEAALWAIRSRAREEGLLHVHVAQGDFLTDRLATAFDAIVGRQALLNVAEVPAALWRLASQLKPGGVLALQELDFGAARSIPSSPTFDDALSWVTRTLAKGGAHPRLGLELRRHFLDAGLPEPTLRIDESLGGTPDYLGYDLLAEWVQGLAPGMKALGVARPEQVDAPSLARRLREEVCAYGGVLVLPSLVGAWARPP